MHVAIRLATSLLLIASGLCHAQCDAVVMVFDETICHSDIALPANMPDTSDVSDPKARLRLERLRLQNKIRAIAAEHLLAESSFTPTQEEIDAFEAFSTRAAARRTKDDEETIAAAEQLLRTHDYDDRFRQSIESTIAAAKRSIELSDELAEDDKIHYAQMRERFGEEYVVKLRKRLSQSRRQSNRRWVASWKMNKALFEKYGGRVIFQQAGIEPIDAYRDHLTDIREKGRLKILKPEYADLFDEFERYLDMGHNYLSEPGDRYFDRPYWETVDLDAEQRKRIEELKATPYKGP